MTLKLVAQWLTLIGMLVGADMWLGRLQQQVTDLIAEQHYLHGDVRVPSQEK